MVDDVARLFFVVDKKAKLFKRRDVTVTLDRMGPLSSAVHDIAAGARLGLANRRVRNVAVSAVAEKFLLEHFAPASVLVDRAGEILFAHGRTGRFLELPAGRATLNVLEMARGGLRYQLARALRSAFARKKAVVVENLHVTTNAETRLLNVTVRPFRDSKIGDLAMVVFQELPEKPAGRSRGKTIGGPNAAARVRRLEEELKQTREQLKTVIQELENANEELASYNEELQSTNEELQSTNEELETSKEELQSLNEELMTINVELQNKNEELARTNDDMRNLLDNTGIATIFLDDQLRIKRFTVEAKKLANLIDSDVGRPLGDITTNLDVDLAARARAVNESSSALEELVKTRDGRLYLLRVIPYCTVQNVIQGVVVILIDVTEHARGREAT
jgi:two-component system CheB/CheR fusion protein